MFKVSPVWQVEYPHSFSNNKEAGQAGGHLQTKYWTDLSTPNKQMTDQVPWVQKPPCCVGIDI